MCVCVSIRVGACISVNMHVCVCVYRGENGSSDCHRETVTNFTISSETEMLREGERLQASSVSVWLSVFVCVCV